MNVTSRRPLILWKAIRTPCMRNYRPQGHAPPPEAVSSCYLSTFLRIGTLSFRNCLNMYLLLLFSILTNFYLFFPKVCRRSCQFYFLSKKTRYLFTLHMLWQSVKPCFNLWGSYRGHPLHFSVRVKICQLVMIKRDFQRHPFG